MSILKFFAIAFFSFISIAAHADTEMIDALVCHECNGVEAKAKAATKFIQPTCSFGDLNGGPAVIDETPIYCAPTQKDVVILNPQDRLVWKYRVVASYPQQYMIQINANPVSVSADEYETANAFFTFFDDVVTATNNGLLQISEPIYSSSYRSAVRSKMPSSYISSMDNSNTAECALVSDFMRSPENQQEVLDFVGRIVVEKLQGTNPYDAHEDTDITGLGVQLDGKSIGLSVQWDSEERPVVAIVGDGTNRLGFDLSFAGVITGHKKGSIVVIPIINKHLSKISGLNFHLAFPNGTIDHSRSTTSDEFSCLRNLAEDMAEDPVWGQFIADGLESSNQVSTHQSGNGITFCVRSVSVRTCSTDSNGQTCTETAYHFPTTCM